VGRERESVGGHKQSPRVAKPHLTGLSGGWEGEPRLWRKDLDCSGQEKIAREELGDKDKTKLFTLLLFGRVVTRDQNKKKRMRSKIRVQQDHKRILKVGG